MVSLRVTKEQKKYKKYIIKDCILLKNRSEEKFMCNLCLSQVKIGKAPKHSKLDKYKFANFPKDLIDLLKRSCQFKEQQCHTTFKEADIEYERKFLQLNRLESHLLKRVIPFIRIAHCPKGPYLKVRGDLILISSDIHHSLSRVLPNEQSLIPVRFKRKLAYSGAYIEEYVEKNKVSVYFSWLKKK